MIIGGQNLLACSTAALSLMGLAGVARADYVANKYTDAASGEVLEYNLFVPAGYDAAKKYPLMVVLHAADTTPGALPRTLSKDGKGWAPTFIASPHQATDPAFFMIPISQTNASGWGEATQPITTAEKFEGRLTVSVLKQQVLTKYSIDPNRLYITGPSMGGRGTWDIIRRYPTVFAAAAPAAAPASPADAALYAGQNIWAICGEVDPIVQGERDTVVAIRQMGGNPIYTELKGHGHDSWRTIYPMASFVDWMFAQRLGVPWTKSAISTAPAVAGLTPGQDQVVMPTGVGNPGVGGSGPGGTSTNGGASGASGGATGSGGSGAIATGGNGPVTPSGGVGSGGSSALPATGGAPPSSGGQPPAGGSTGGNGGPGIPGGQLSSDDAGGCSVGGAAPGATGLGAALTMFGLFFAGRRLRQNSRTAKKPRGCASTRGSQS